MTDADTIEFRRDGDSAEFENTENEDSEDTTAETNDDGDTHSPDGDKNSQDDSDTSKPLNEHPRWKEREDEWNRRFNDQETRHQDDLKKIREEFGDARKENRENTAIPSWFGGNQEQWDAYRADQDTQLKAAEDRALERIKSEKNAQDEAVKAATDFMNSEILSIESDTTLNPEGKKIDPAKLLKVVMDNDLIDSKGRWNYRAGYKLMNQSVTKKPPVVNPERKTIAGATNSDSKPETKPVTYKTSADFKKPGAKPW